MAFIKESSSGIKVQIVNSLGQADLWVYVTKNKNEAKNKDAIWFFDNSGKTKIKFVKASGDLKVYYVRSKNQAKWKKPHKLMERLN